MANSYPTDRWKQLTSEDKEFMRELKSVFPNVQYLGEIGLEGVKVFQTTPWERKGYWPTK